MEEIRTDRLTSIIENFKMRLSYGGSSDSTGEKKLVEEILICG
jgi:hypothetical protein